MQGTIWYIDGTLGHFSIVVYMMYIRPHLCTIICVKGTVSKIVNSGGKCSEFPEDGSRCAV